MDNNFEFTIPLGSDYITLSGVEAVEASGLKRADIEFKEDWRKQRDEFEQAYCEPVEGPLTNPGESFLLSNK